MIRRSPGPGPLACREGKHGQVLIIKVGTERVPRLARPVPASGHSLTNPQWHLVVLEAAQNPETVKESGKKRK